MDKENLITDDDNENSSKLKSQYQQSMLQKEVQIMGYYDQYGQYHEGDDGSGALAILAAIIFAIIVIVVIILFIAYIIALIASAIGSVVALYNYGKSFKNNVIDSNRKVVKA